MLKQQEQQELQRQQKKQILIIEDEVKIARLLEDYLNNAGYMAKSVNTGANAVELIREKQPDCVILDVMLPVNDGLSICRDVREFSTVPIIMITARVDEIDRLLGLELGADDYICKPFSPREVVARVRNILRRVDLTVESVNDEQSKQTVRYDGLFMDYTRQSCGINDQLIEITSVEFRMLFAMAQCVGQIFSRNQLMALAYQDSRIVSDRTIDTHIKNIRKKIADVTEQELIHSVYGRGYKVE